MIQVLLGSFLQRNMYLNQVFLFLKNNLRKEMIEYQLKSDAFYMKAEGNGVGPLKSLF